MDGFEDSGGENRSQRLADKDRVFMARGIHKKLKQPLTYYFNSGGMKSAVLTKAIKDMIRSARSSGLKMVATVFDQGGPNRAAINSLYEETKRNFALQGKENHGFGFFIDDEEVVPLYDPPHL
ncbi:unnamed protein product [Brassicogethes aeneus]|uniref:Transposable element P transposase-like RNase H domain-containing protein n=1 Tax=Brassicogethes aeneus TaxID=1431903 RepID=A0A9P0AQH7_BRAAE|nr:unnamed protein product [Brassicogethes aeneus]